MAGDSISGLVVIEIALIGENLIDPTAFHNNYFFIHHFLIPAMRWQVQSNFLRLYALILPCPGWKNRIIRHHKTSILRSSQLP